MDASVETRPLPPHSLRSSRSLWFDFDFVTTVLTMVVVMLSCGGFAFDGLRFEVAAASEGGSFNAHERITRRGRELDAMVLVAPVTIRAPLDGLSGTATLECLAAPVFNIGDGMRLDVLLGNAAGEHVVYTRYFDPGRRAGDRDWIPLSVSFETPAVVGTQLILRLSAGPQGDLVADWLALASVRLSRRTTSR